MTVDLELPMLRTSERKAFKRCRKPRGKYGEDHPNWSGDQASYDALHQRLRAIRGPAAQFQCFDCGLRAMDWSQTHGTSGKDIHEHYNARCRSCHNTYDGKVGNLQGHQVRGSQHGLSKLTEDDIPKIRARLANGEVQRVIALDYGVHQVTISRIKTGKDWSHIASEVI